MDLNALLERYQTLFPWHRSRTKCFVSMILGIISSGSVQQHKAALGFSGATQQKSVCARIRNFLKDFKFDFSDYARAILEMAHIKGKLTLSLDRTHWKFGCIDINLLVVCHRSGLHSPFMEGSAEGGKLQLSGTKGSSSDLHGYFW